MRTVTFTIILFILSLTANTQVNDKEVGSWFMYFYNTGFGESPWGIQGDAQHRNWNVTGDLEQLLLRSGVTYDLNDGQGKFTLGYANITTGAYGDSKSTVMENRVYQEALLPHKISNRFYLKHRYRFEQRFMDNGDFRTRFRYNLFFTVPFNQKELNKGAFYLALYNELFINGQRRLPNSTVRFFDRNRFYSALGYAFLDNLKVQAGYMQQTTTTWNKGQLQLSLHYKY